MAAGRKALYIHELVDDWRTRLGVGPPPADAITLTPADGLDGPSWAEAEFGAAAFNDARLTARLVTIAQLKGARPMASFPQAASGNRAGIKGYYRFIDQPEKTPVTPLGHPGAVPRPHAGAHAGRAGGAVHPGRNRPELRIAPGMRGARGHRHQPDRRHRAGPASAFDAGGDPGWPAAGGCLGPL